MFQTTKQFDDNSWNVSHDIPFWISMSYSKYQLIAIFHGETQQFKLDHHHFAKPQITSLRRSRLQHAGIARRYGTSTAVQEAGRSFVRWS